MENLNKEVKKVTINTQPMVDYLADQLWPLDLVEIIDRVQLQYTLSVLDGAAKGEVTPNDVAKNYWELHRLKEVLRECQNAI